MGLGGGVAGLHKNESDGLSDFLGLSEAESVLEDDVLGDEGVELSVDPETSRVDQRGVSF